MLKAAHTRQFQRDVKRAVKHGLDIRKLEKIADKLLKQEKLHRRYKDHKLTGNYKTYRECHIAPDWLLIYRPGKKEIIFERTGTHAHLFK